MQNAPCWQATSKIIETKILTSSSKKQYLLHYSRSESKTGNGVGVILSPEGKVTFKPINDKICQMTRKSNSNQIIHISAYALLWKRNKIQKIEIFPRRFSLELEFSKLFKVVSISTASNISLIHQKQNTTFYQQLHQLRHEPNYERELAKCNFLRSQTVTPVGQFCKSGWYKFHQQHMSTLTTNRNLQLPLGGSFKDAPDIQRYRIHFSARSP